MSKPQIKMWSVQEGKLVTWFLEEDTNGEIVASHKNETLKFPGGLSKKEFLAHVSAHNEANKGVRAVSEEDLKAEETKRAMNKQLLESL